MQEISKLSEWLVTRLVAWEVLGSDEVDPRSTLRRVSLADLSALHDNIIQQPELQRFAVPQLVGLELMQRQGLIEDWSVTRKDECITITPLSKTAKPLPS
jgi:hypothetical protein